MDATSILDRCRFFGEVRGESRARLVAMAVLKRYDRGETVFHVGDPCPGVFIVGDGAAKVFLVGASGREQILHFVTPGNTFAEVAAIGGFDCPANAAAVEASTCLLLPNGPFRQALQDDHQLCLQLLRSFAGWVRHFVGLLEDITLRDAAGRLARYLLLQPEDGDGGIKLPGLKRHLAEHLNLTSETLSRTLRRLTDAGLITEDEHGIAIADRAGLEKVASGQ